MKLTPFHILDKSIDWSFRKFGLDLLQTSIDKFEIEYWAADKHLPVLVLCHAYGPDSKYSWYKQVRKLSKHFRLIIPNLIYFGNSTMAPKSYEVSDQVDALALLLKELKIEQFSIGGTSYGGLVACELALLNEFKIERLFLSNAPIKYVYGGDWEEMLKLFQVEKRSEVLVPKDYKKLFKLYRISRKKLSLAPRFIFRNIHKNLYVKQAEERRMLTDTFVENHDKYSKRDYKFDFPVLLIWGAGDKLSPLETGRQLKEHLGENASLRVMKGTGHMPNIERPFTFMSILLPFLLNNEK
ncbi:MAG: pimeloyl-ACP methyl ester carboxylesterase [Salibacteraceae bacterium]|jgi:pimeloyl-ACP methyl ester carboxylesterase